MPGVRLVIDPCDDLRWVCCSGANMIEEIERAVDRRLPEAVELLRQLIRFPSVSGEEQAVVEFLRDCCLRSSLEARVVPIPESIKSDEDYSHGDRELSYAGRGNLVLGIEGTGGGRSIILQSHLDVVPADPQWQEAFDGRLDGDWVHGRGAVDAKGQCVTILLGLLALRDAGVKLKGNIEAQFVIEEEIGGNGALALIQAGHRAEAALIVEGTNLQIHPANRGALWFRAKVTGKSVHMGRIREGVSAIAQAMELIAILRGYEQRLIAESKGQELFARYQQPVQLNVGMMRAGDWPATVPGEAVLEGGIGFLPDKAIADLKRELREVVEQQAGPWLKEHCEIDFPKLHNDAYQTSPEHPFVGALAAACHQAGLSSEVFGWNVSCDARLYHHRGGMPTVVFGPGDIAQAHSTHEKFDTRDSAKAATAIAALLANWCGVA
jgi:acetylornithine deacetylase